MALTADQVRVGFTGGVYVAPSGTALPTTAVAALNAAFVEMGYLTEEGISQSLTEQITDVRAWQNGDVVRSLQTAHDVTYGFEMLEHSAETLEVYYGNFDGGAVQVTGDQLVNQCWIFQVVDGDNIIRIVVPDGKITERGDVVYRNDQPVGYPVTIKAFPVNGVKAYIYLSGPDS